MKILGLTGGIGMGKSTAAAAFRRARIPVFDADAAVHRMQARGGRAVRAIEAAFPGTVRDGAVDRVALRHAVLGKPDALDPPGSASCIRWSSSEERAFVARARRQGNRAVVLDIPLLFETDGDRRVDRVIVVIGTAPRCRCTASAAAGGMSDADIEAVIARQMPDAEKRRRADVVVRTGLSRHHSLKTLSRLIREVRA